MDKSFEKLYDELYEKGLNDIEQMAREVLAKNPTLDYYMMAMGMAFFVDKEGETVQFAEKQSMAKLDQFMDEYDHMNFSGSPMKIMRNEPRQTDW